MINRTRKASTGCSRKPCPENRNDSLTRVNSRPTARSLKLGGGVVVGGSKKSHRKVGGQLESVNCGFPTLSHCTPVGPGGGTSPKDKPEAPQYAIAASSSNRTLTCWGEIVSPQLISARDGLHCRGLGKHDILLYDEAARTMDPTTVSTTKRIFQIASSIVFW